MMGKPTIRSPLQIGACRLKNRLVALPVFTGYAYPDGGVSPPLLAHYTALAATGVAMVVVANVAISAEGVTSRYNLRIDSDASIPGLRALAEAIREQGALACIQLNHAGRFAKTAQPLLASAADTSNFAYNLAALKDFINSFPFERRFGLTGFFLKRFSGWHRSMTEAECDGVLSRYREAALRAHAAGFDMIELHGANGYLLCEFLSPAANRLKSGFGGGLENRMTFPLAVVGAVRGALPPEKPLGFRLLLNEWVPGGITLQEALVFAGRLEKAGIGYLSGSAGTFNSMFRPQVVRRMAQPAYLREEMAALTGQVSVPTIISGRVTTPSLADALLRQGAADLIGLGRALRVDCDWVQKALDRGGALRTCRNCNWCLKRVVLEEGFCCRRWPHTRQLETDLDHMMLTRNYRSLWVIAGEEDRVRFERGLPALFPGGRWWLPEYAPTVLFLRPAGQGLPEGEKAGIMAWARQQAGVFGREGDFLSTLEREVHGGWDEIIGEETRRGRYGVILIGRDRRDAWRERLVYTLHHKVVGLVSPNERLGDVAALLDFSASSLLIARFLKHAYGNRPCARLGIFHVLSGGERHARWQWGQIKAATGFETDAPLVLIPSQGNTAAALVKEIQAGGYGTIIMGKRGLSGIKRLLLGSVSRAVMRKMEDQSLFLVD
jgi:2,4-dienoyl-CoA reductase-like NADH-dependent reductase (Old Yellow Enzyme family)